LWVGVARPHTICPSGRLPCSGTDLDRHVIGLRGPSADQRALICSSDSPLDI
jgi:hypothetical protein